MSSQASGTLTVTGAGTFSFVQRVAGHAVYATNLICSGNPSTCTLTFDGTANKPGSALGSGHGLILMQDEDNLISLSSVTGGCSVAWVVQSSAHVLNGSFGEVSGATCTSSSSATSVSYTYTSGIADGLEEAALYEFSYSGSSISFATANAASLGSVTNPVGTTLTGLSGTNVVVQLMYAQAGVSAVSSPFNTNYSKNDSNGGTMFAGTSYLLNTANGTAPTWTAASGQAVGNAVALHGN